MSDRKLFPLHEISFSEALPIERKTAAGPLVGNLMVTDRHKSQETTNTTISSIEEDDETERRVSLALKKAQPKEVTTLDGRINIITQVEASKEALCCKYNEEFDYIAVGYTDGVIRVYLSATGEYLFSLTDNDVKENRAPVTSIKHRPVSKTYPITNCFTGTYANGCVKCWSYNFNQCLYTIREKRQTFGITYHPRVPKFVTFGDDKKIYFYDEESKIQERVLMASDNPDQHDGHMSRVFAACFHPRNSYELITGGWDDVVQFWDLRQPYATRHLSGIHMCGEGLDINQRGTEILTCAFQHTTPLQIFDYGSGKRISCADPDIYNSRLYCGKYATKDFIIAGGTDQNILRIIDTQTITTIASINYLPGAVYALDLGPTKKRQDKVKEQARLKTDISMVPRVAFISAKKLYQIDFY